MHHATYMYVCIWWLNWWINWWTIDFHSVHRAKDFSVKKEELPAALQAAHNPWEGQLVWRIISFIIVIAGSFVDDDARNNRADWYTKLVTVAWNVVICKPLHHCATIRSCIRPCGSGVSIYYEQLPSINQSTNRWAASTIYSSINDAAEYHHQLWNM